MKTVAIESGTAEPVSLADLKTYLRVSSGDIEDRVLKSMLRAARMSAESFARISISPRKWRSTFVLPQYARGSMDILDPDEVQLKVGKLRRPLLSVESVQVMNQRGEPITTPPYAVSIAENAVFWTNGSAGLEPRRYWQDGAYLLIMSTAGYPLIPLPNPLPQGMDPATAERLCDAPDDVQEAIRLTIADIYENRGSDSTRGLPMQAKMLLRSVWTSVL